MELKLLSNFPAFVKYKLLIAPLMELKFINLIHGFPTRNAFNRTAYGIEMSIFNRIS